MSRQARLPLEALAPYLLEAPQEDGPLNPAAIFGNTQPIELEVGFGKGLFLLTACVAHPERNYLGIEIERKYQLHTATRLAKLAQPNVRLICADAKDFLPRHLAGGALHAMHVYFPDPWWKNRHRKRRLFTADFTAECARLLRPEGILHIATDVADYFQVMQGLLAQQPQLELLPETDGQERAELTNFERKYRVEGRPIYRARYRRR